MRGVEVYLHSPPPTPTLLASPLEQVFTYSSHNCCFPTQQVSFIQLKLKILKYIYTHRLDNNAIRTRVEQDFRKGVSGCFILLEISVRVQPEIDSVCLNQKIPIIWCRQAGFSFVVSLGRRSVDNDVDGDRRRKIKFVLQLYTMNTEQPLQIYLQFFSSVSACV